MFRPSDLHFVFLFMFLWLFHVFYIINKVGGGYLSFCCCFIFKWACGEEEKEWGRYGQTSEAVAATAAHGAGFPLIEVPRSSCKRWQIGDALRSGWPGRVLLGKLNLFWFFLLCLGSNGFCFKFTEGRQPFVTFLKGHIFVLASLAGVEQFSGSIEVCLVKKVCVRLFIFPVVPSLLKFVRRVSKLPEHHVQSGVCWAIKSYYLFCIFCRIKENIRFHICELLDYPSFAWLGAELSCQRLHSGCLDSFQHEMSGCQAHIECIGTEEKHFCEPLWCTSRVSHTVLLQSLTALPVVPHKQILVRGWKQLCWGWELQSSWLCTLPRRARSAQPGSVGGRQYFFHLLPCANRVCG